MRALFASTGGLGHVLPMRRLALALRREGCAVGWATAPDVLAPLAADGFEVFAAGPDFVTTRQVFRSAYPEMEALQGESLSAFTFPRLFGATLAPMMLDALGGVLDRWKPDLVIHEPAAFAAVAACEARGVRRVIHQYGLSPPQDYLQAAVSCFRLRAPKALHVPDPLPAAPSIEVTPGSLRGANASGDRWALNIHGPLTPAINATEEPACAMLAPSGRPRVYVSFGTVFRGSRDLTVAAEAACAAGGTVLVTSGHGAPPLGLGSRAGLHVLPFVQQDAVLPLVDAVISHGGAGTAFAAAAQGLPQVILPQAADHFRNADALAERGAALVLERNPGVDEVHSALRRALESPAVGDAAKRLATEFDGLAPARRVARQLMQWSGESLT